MHNDQPKKRYLSILLFLSAISQAQSIKETQTSIHQLDHKILILKNTISLTHDRQHQLQQELKQTDRDIQQHVIKLALIQKQLTQKKADITGLEKRISDLSQQFKNLQDLLSQQIQARYKQPTQQPLAFLFTNAQHSHSDKLLTYYQYIIRANKKTIDHLKATQADLAKQQQQLQLELDALKKLHAQSQQEQQQLATHKTHHKALLDSLHQHIENQEKTLSSYQINRNNLSKLLLTLNQQSVIQTRHPMTKMKRQLPNPVNVSTDQIHKLNQGIILYSPEGSPVHAIYPGKVVFAAWLNGYGLLMIIDHGWGLMTLYANNLALMKQKGDTVNQGDQIATVGHSGTLKQSGLYFEVRQRGKAISPLDWLRSKK